MNINRIAINIAAALVLILGFLGYRLYQAETQKESVTKEFDSFKVEQATRLSAAEKALKDDEARIALEMKKTDEALQRLTVEQQRRMEAEERLRRMEGAQSGSGRLEPARSHDDRQRVSIVSQQDQGQPITQTEQDKVGAPQSTVRASGAEEIVVRTRLDAHSAVQVPLARVRAGDQVTVTVRRMGQANRQLLVGLGPVVRDSTGNYSNGLLGGRRTVSKPIKDQDRFVISFDLLSAGKGRFKLNTEHGAILYLGAEDSRTSQAAPGEAGGVGHYDIELTIRQHNRWGIAPESLN